ncbi:MAG: hypothetical protein ACXVIG_07205 [Halobacteriota archaeon]
MKRMTLTAIALCLIMIATVGAGVVAAKQENPHQAGKSSIYFYDVTAPDEHGKGKLQINLDKHTFVFNGQGFTPSQQIELKAKAVGSTDYAVFATGKATPSGNLHKAGTWEAAAAPANVVASSGFVVTIDSAILYQWGRLTVTGTANTGLSLTLISVSHPTEAIATTKGDPNGRYTLSGISADTEQALWRYPYMKFAVLDAEGNTLATTTTLTIVNGVLTLDPLTSDPVAGHDFTLTGKLTYANGQPVPQGDAEVYFWLLNNGKEFGPATTFDSATGAYSYTVKGGLPAGSYSIEAEVYNALTDIGTGPDSMPITFTVQSG